jgi:tetratricopeptide (TPR) repeat protein
MQYAYAKGMAQVTAGWLCLAKGDFRRARPLVEQATTEYRQGSILISLCHALASSARILAQIGEIGEALNCLREGEELLGRQIADGTIDQAGMDYRWLGRAGLLLGRLGDAQRLANLSLQCSPSHPGYAAHAHRLLGDIAADPEQLNADAGEVHYRKALELAEPRGMRPLVAHCHLGLTKLYQRVGKQEQAEGHVATATTLYREMDMTFWLEQAESAARHGFGPQ